MKAVVAAALVVLSPPPPVCLPRAQLLLAAGSDYNAARGAGKSASHIRASSYRWAQGTRTRRRRRVRTMNMCESTSSNGGFTFHAQANKGTRCDT